jgi:tetratricopeptide (TPR) repeat protein
VESGTGRVIEPLLALEREDGTGLLDFRARGISTRIHVRAGEIVFVEGGAIGETLGRMLVRWGRLTERQSNAILHRLVEGIVENEHLLYGDVLVRYGFVTLAELDALLVAHVREKLVSAVCRGPGSWTFTAGDDAVSRDAYSVETRPMIMTAVSELSERHIEEILELSEIRYPHVVASPGVVAAEFDLSPEETAVLSDFDGTSALPFLVSKWATVGVLPLAAGLVLGDGVELRRTPATKSDERPLVPPAFRTRRRARPRSDGSNLEDRTIQKANASFAVPVLYQSEAASSLTMRAAKPWYERSPREAIDVPLDAAARAREALMRLDADLEARRSASGARRWPSQRSDRARRLMAESAFQKGRGHLVAEEVERALPGLERAVEIRPEEAEYELSAKWARLLASQAFGERERRAEVLAIAAGVLARDRTCAIACSILGHCMHLEGREQAALRFFHKALKLDAKLADAERIASTIKPRPPSGRDLVARPRRDNLPTPIDELIPLPLEVVSAPATVPKPSPPGLTPALRPGALTPRGGLQVEATLEGLPAPPAYTPAMSPAISLPPPPGSTPPPIGSFAPPPIVLAPPAPMPIPSANETAAMAPPRLPTLPLVQSASFSPPPPHERPASRGVPIAIALVLIALGGGAAMLAFRGRTKSGVASGPSASPAASVASASVPPANGDSASANPSIASASSNTPSANATASGTAKSTGSGSVATASPSNATALAAASAAAAAKLASSGATTATLRTTRAAYGRRIYVDGKIVGEGGHPLSVPCGEHRVRIGSAGTERVVHLPCGESIELE